MLHCISENKLYSLSQFTVFTRCSLQNTVYIFTYYLYMLPSLKGDLYSEDTYLGPKGLPWIEVWLYSQLSPCRHLTITDTPTIRTAAKSQEKINNRHLAEINSRYNGLLIMRTLTRGPYSVRYNKSWLYLLLKFFIIIVSSFSWVLSTPFTPIQHV